MLCILIVISMYSYCYVNVFLMLCILIVISVYSYCYVNVLLLLRYVVLLLCLSILIVMYVPFLLTYLLHGAESFLRS